MIEWLKTVEVDGGEYITIECDEDTVAFIDSDAESVVFTKTAWRKFMADVRSGEYDV